MKNVQFKFKVTSNNNTYYATSLKAISSYCKLNDLVLTDYYHHFPIFWERKSAHKCGRGIYCILDSN